MRADGRGAVLSPLVLALALGAVLGAGLTGVLIALSVVYTPTFARLMRGQVLSIKARDYVEAARALGASELAHRGAPRAAERGGGHRGAGGAQRGLRHSRGGVAVLPGARHPAPAASWGSMINAGRGYLQQAPWIVFGPAPRCS